MKRVGLRTRLARMEAQSVRRPLPRVVMGIYDRGDEDVIGYSMGKISVARLPGEALEALQERAFRLTGAVTLATLYDTKRASYDDPTDLPSPSPVPPDPFGLPGIGRVATRAELEQMGAVRLPLERPH